MAKLLDVKEDDEKKKNRIKVILLLFSIGALLLAALIYYSVGGDELTHEAAAPSVGVHIKGAVVNSGYYEVPYGTRVVDLEDIVGGYASDVDLEGVNLAAYIEDGEEVYFPHKGSAEKGAINLNNADFETLMTLDGVGEASARKIVDYREAHGGFKSVLELRDILGEAKYKSLREKVCVE